MFVFIAAKKGKKAVIYKCLTQSREEAFKAFILRERYGLLKYMKDVTNYRIIDDKESSIAHKIVAVTHWLKDSGYIFECIHIADLENLEL